MAVAFPELVGGGRLARNVERGTHSEPKAPAHLCRHCGSPASGSEEFCCAGCAYVHRLVHEHGLAGYYKIRDTVVAPVDGAVFQPRDYGWLTELQVQAELARGVPVLVLEVQGISCAGCVWLIEKLFHQQWGALRIITDAPSGRLELCWMRGAMDLPAFARTLQTFNYLVGPAGSEPAEPESRRLVRRIGLCAAFAMNIMLFAFPVYFGMEATFPYAHLFGTLAMGGATLSVLVGGAYFIRRAVAALRSRALHIDQPIAVGIIGAYMGSLYGWLAGREHFVYFDFVGAFILLMLIGRWAQLATVERNRQRLLRAQAQPRRVRRLGADGSIAEVAVEELRPGDSFLVRSGETVPVEAQLESSLTVFGTAWISGESAPRSFRTGARVPAGALLAARGEARLRAQQAWSESLLARLLQPGRRDAPRHRFLERVVAGYLIAIFGVAAAAGIFWWWRTHDVVQAGAVVTAVLVVSCPCAVGLAFPLADEIAAVAARRGGVFVREADLWPRLARVRRVLFDKTGTLTLETPVLQNPATLAQLTPLARAALEALVRDNAHPVSQSLFEELQRHPGTGSEAAPRGSFTEHPGRGMALETSGGRWTLGRPGWAASDPRVGKAGEADTEFALNGVILARFVFADTLRPGAAAEVAALRADGFAVHILSGDRSEKVALLAAELGVEPACAQGGLTPQQKEAAVRLVDRSDTLMLGDGANDSLAFDAAWVRGTPVIHRGVLEGKSDFYYLGQGLGGLRRLFAIDRSRRRTQTALLVFSVLYNCLAVGLAASGHMSPLLAAILMPVSSLVTLAIVGVGLRRWLR